MRNKFLIFSLVFSTVFLFSHDNCQLHAQAGSQTKKDPQGSETKAAPQGSGTKEVPDGFKQVLPRGGIPSIDNPSYVAADKASISDEAYVLGVVVEGQPIAYSLNLLNRHEVVNDTIGDTNFAAVW